MTKTTTDAFIASRRAYLAAELLKGCPADSRADHEAIAEMIRRGDSAESILSSAECDRWPETYTWLNGELVGVAADSAPVLSDSAEDEPSEPSLSDATPAVCGCCGGHLPADRDSHLRDDGECPGSVTTDRTGRVLGCGAYTADAYRAEPESDDEPDGYLHDYVTGAMLRSATVEECIASRRAAKVDGECGVITVDGRRCYVQE